MTAQIHDIIRYRDQLYEVAGVAGEGLFNPEAHGLVPKIFSTACWRGYHCGYAVEQVRLLLEQVNMGLEESFAAGGAYLFGKKFESYTYDAKRLDKGEWSPVTCIAPELRITNLWEPVQFSGGLLACNEYIREMNVHMGYRPAYKFRQVHELIFEDGHLVKELDWSKDMTDFREKANSLPESGGPTREELEQLIKSRFSFDYKLGDA